jgi:hypothetical protein
MLGWRVDPRRGVMKMSSHRPDGIPEVGLARTTAQGFTMTSPDMTRQICRLGGVYLVERARFVARTIDRNFVTALIFLAITRANVAGITNSRMVAMRHLGVDEIPSDSHRLPVTIYALARDLRMPYETVRRHVAKLKAADICISLADGVIIPSEAFRSPIARAGAVRAGQSVSDFVNAAARSGITAHGRYQAVANDVTLQVARLSTDYFVDGVGSIARNLDLDVLSVLVMMTPALMNVEAITRDPELSRAYGGLADVPADALRAPVSVYAVSKHLMLPYETTRRIALGLVERDLLARDQAGGLTMPATAAARPDMLVAFSEFAVLTLAFLGNLAEYGVVARAEALLSGSPTWNPASAMLTA